MRPPPSNSHMLVPHLFVRLCSPGGKCVPLVPHHLHSPTMAAASQAMLYDLPAPALGPAPLCAPHNNNNNNNNNATRHGDDVMVTTRRQRDNNNNTATTTTT